MLELLTDLMQDAVGRCAYAEARHVDARSEAIAVLNGRVDAIDSSGSGGIGVRVQVGGGWGFAATRERHPRRRPGGAGPCARPRRGAARDGGSGPGAGRAGRRALGLALPRSIRSTITLEDKLELLFAVEAALRIGDERLVRTAATCRAWRERKAFASTEGAACTQETVAAGAGIVAYATDGSDLQVRSYPTAHGGGLSAAAGWEHVLSLDLAGHAPRVAEEAVALLSAPQCPAGTSTIVLHGEQVALQVHESIGHALELDRILLGEASYAGTSWVGPDDLGSLRYGSELLHVTADATLPHGLGSFGWDDEGVAAARADLVEGGVLRGALSNRESAAAVGLSASSGCARADGFARQPIVRMTNVSLEPGAVPTLADLVADTDAGLYLETNRSWSIDDRRLQFQFATELCREIRGGELGRLYRNGSYAGVTPRFWGSLDAICGPAEWRLWGLANCGKGEPGQVMVVSHGAAPARFRDVQVGVA